METWLSRSIKSQLTSGEKQRVTKRSLQKKSYCFVLKMLKRITVLCLWLFFPQTKPICKGYVVLTESISWWTNASTEVFFQLSQLTVLLPQRKLPTKEMTTITEIAAWISRIQHSLTPCPQISSLLTTLTAPSLHDRCPWYWPARKAQLQSLTETVAGAHEQGGWKEAKRVGAPQPSYGAVKKSSSICSSEDAISCAPNFNLPSAISPSYPTGNRARG